MTTEEVTKTPTEPQETPAATPETGVQPPTPAAEATPAPSVEDLQRKIDGLQQGITAERQKRQALERERAEQPRPAESINANAPPKVEDYEDYEDYLVGKATYNLEIKQRQKDQEALKAQQQAEAVRNAQQFNQRSQAAKEKYADFDQIVNNPNLPITDEMAAMIQADEKGPDLAYHLGKNPELAYELAQSNPLTVAMRLGEIKASISQQKPNIPMAPDPIQPIGGAETPVKDTSKMSTAEWMEWRRSQLQR